jgi:hypothetical protein
MVYFRRPNTINNQNMAQLTRSDSILVCHYATQNILHVNTETCEIMKIDQLPKAQKALVIEHQENLEMNKITS